MRVCQLFDAGSSTYTYLVRDPASRKAVLIDPVFEQYSRDAALVRELDLELLFTLETHVHADHVTAAWLFKKGFSTKSVVSRRAGVLGADVLVDDGDVVRFGAAALEVRATPGHTDGCVTYVSVHHDVAFTGDALLIRGAGRTDFQQGDAKTLFRSITSQIFTLPDDCTLYPGHDYSGRTSTTVEEERRHNPRVGGGANERDFVGYMENLGLPHPKQMDVAVPANIRGGRPEVEVIAPTEWGPAVLTYAGVLEIDPVWVSEHPEDVTVVDVRDADEIATAGGRIRGSVHIPLGALRDRLAEVPLERPVVFVCRSGRRSAQATSIFRQNGCKECANVAGGMLRWQALGLPVV